MTNQALDPLPAKPIYRTVKTSRLYEQIVQQVEDSITNGQLKPGDQLPAERDLAQRFGVSRTAVREAVKTLREKGLVEAFPAAAPSSPMGRPKQSASRSI